MLAAATLGQDTARGADRYIYADTRGVKHIRDTLPADARGNRLRESAALFEARRMVYIAYTTKVYIFTRIPPVVTSDGGKVIRDGLADRLPPHTARCA
jgi:hypothetical protein